MTRTRDSDPAKPRGRRRRRLIPLAGLLALCILAGLGFRQVALGAEGARRGIVETLAAMTGQPVTIGASSDFTLLPVARLTLSDVAIGSGGAGLRLSVERITADLDLWQALLGRTRIERLVLLRPEVAAPAGASPETSLPDAFGPLLHRLHDVSEIVIRDGVLSRGGGIAPAIVSAANLRLSWPAEAAAANLSGTYAWNGQPVELSLDVAAPRAWLDGAASAVDLVITSPLLDLAFDGEASEAGRLSGRVSTSLPALGRSLRWLTRARQVIPEIGPIVVAADLVSDGRRLQLSDAAVSVNGFAGRGAIEIAFPEDRRPSIGGTLAFERLDLDGIADALAPRPTTAIEALRPISVDFADRLDMDLRISAEAGRIGPLALTDLAGTMKLRDGRATLDIGDAGLLGGRGQMRVSLDTATAPPVLKGSASLAGVEAGGLLAALGLSSGAVAGPADIALAAEAPVANWAGILGRHRMTATLSMRAGSVAGLDPQALRTGGTRVYDGASASVLPFRSLTAEIASEGSRMALRSLRMTGETGTLEAAGRLADAEGGVDLSGAFEPAAAVGSEPALTKPKPLAATMRGFWPHPVLVLSAPPD